MPQVQVIDTTENKPEPTGVQEFFSKLGKNYKDKQDRVEIGKIINDYSKNRQDANSLFSAYEALEKSNVGPTKRLQAKEDLMNIEKAIISKDKALNKDVRKGMLTQEEKVRQKDNLTKAGYPDYIADIYLDAPPGVQQTIQREHADLVSRGFRKPLVQVPQGIDNQTAEAPTQTPAPTPENIVAEEKAPIFVDETETPSEKAAVTKAPKEVWPDPVVPIGMTPAESVKWQNNNEKENNKLLKETQEKKKAHASNDILINSMTKVNDSGKLPSGIGRLIIDPVTGDIKAAAQIAGLVNPETQLYVKNLKQWLKGAKDFFGARVTNFDVSSFMQQLPSLLNSEQGRRLILKQMKYVNDLEAIHNNTLNEGLKTYGRKANYNQVVQEADKKVSDREQDLLGKINNLVEASGYINMVAENPEKFRNTVMMQKPDGTFRAVPKEKVEALKAKKWRDF